MTASGIGAALRNPWVKYGYATSFPHGTPAVAGCFDRTNATALTLAVNGGAQLWSVEDEGRIGPRLWAIGPPLDARLSDDGRSALIRTAAPAVWLWRWPAQDGALAAYSAAEWAALAERADFHAEETARSGDGRRLVARLVDGQSVRIADAETGDFSTPPMVHPAAVAQARFSRDGRLLCTVWGGKFARVWETATGEPATPPFEHPDIADAAWHADGRRLATLGKDGGARVWDLTPATQPVAELRTLAQLLSAHRMIPGSDSGSVTAMNTRHGGAPRSEAASFSVRSSRSSAAYNGRIMNGRYE